MTNIVSQRRATVLGAFLHGANFGAAARAACRLYRDAGARRDRRASQSRLHHSYRWPVELRIARQGIALSLSTAGVGRRARPKPKRRTPQRDRLTGSSNIGYRILILSARLFCRFSHW